MSVADPALPTGADPPGYIGVATVVVNYLVAALATIAVGLRLWARRVHKVSLQADDYLIMAALPFGWGMCVATVLAVRYGLGRHIETLTPEAIAAESKSFFASELIWATSIPIIKISILLLYVRIFGRLRYFRVLAYCLGVFSVCWGIMVVLVCAFQCRPMRYLWDRTIEGSCINAGLFFIIGSAPNVITDFLILILPLPAVMKLQTSKMQKLSLMTIFLLGSITCIISLIRFVELIQNATNPDVTWGLAILGIWSTAEPCLGIVVACLPTLRPLFVKMRQHTSKGSKGSKNSYIHSDSGVFVKPQAKGSWAEVSGGLDRHDDPYGGARMETSISSLPDEHPAYGLSGTELPLNVIKVQTETNWKR